MAWLVGHLIWARKSVLERLGAEWTALGLYARGAKLDPSSACPSPAELLSAWGEVSALLGQALEDASEEALSQPVTQGPPSADGKVGVVINFLAYHETYPIYAAGWGTKA